MGKFRWKNLIFWVLIAEAVGVATGLLTHEGVEQFQMTVQRPSLSPPRWVFPVVWPILYALMGIGASQVSQTPDSRERSRGLNLMVIQFVFNFFWSPLFFNAQAYGFSLVCLIALWLLVLWMIIEFRKTVPLAAWLQIPYLLWLSFAVYLNAGVWFLNK